MREEQFSNSETKYIIIIIIMIGRRRQAGKRDIKKGERVNKPQEQ